MVVLDEVGIPLVGLAADESVVALESLAERPRLAVAALGDILLRNVVVLAQPEGAVAVVLQDLRDGGGLRRDTAAQPGNPFEASVMAAMPFKVWLRPVRSVDRVGEQSATVCHCV